ncbi:AAA family ATPase [Haloimpatiens lingqiaonensis]|uniref:AAA family ATPase n=1 Tax=Haloimpatiens lingqiaonensis TaxID=1380675 RepID=UPI0010FF6199|nr:AAA family ATPase [Haloimpatiens lingqiaonensis]
MYRKLTPKEVVYNVELNSLNIRDIEKNLYYKDVFKAIKTALSINNEGYNLYLIDDFSKEKVKNIADFANEIYKNKKSPKDICYITDEEDRRPRPLFLGAAMGNLLKEIVEEIKNFYFSITFDFYNNSASKEKEEIIDLIDSKRNDAIERLIIMSKEKGFHMKAVHNGFTFIPLDNGKEMTENEYDELGEEEKKHILDNISELKEKSREIIEELKDLEDSSIDKIKTIFKLYYEEKSYETKVKYKKIFKEEKEALRFLEKVCEDIEESIVENYSSNYSNDEDSINGVLDRFKVNVLVDNACNKNPQCIFEEDPSIQNLIGSIEYENKNGTYTTDISLIKGGTLLKANGGCVIIRIKDLLSSANSYYYFKKFLITGMVDFNYNKGYLEILSLSGLNPEPIGIKTKIILIGDEETYNLLYRYDEDFKKLFKIRAEYYPVGDIEEKSIGVVMQNIKSICQCEKILDLRNDAVEEIVKYLSRMVESNKKIYLDKDEIKKVTILSNCNAQEKDQNFISRDDVLEAVYKEEIIEKNILNSYKEKKQFISVNESKIGQINGLSVIDGEYFRIGKPIRITCSCYRGNGNIFDVQKESDLSGNIHRKSINILKGLINNLLGGYDSLPVDFHISFEQLYGYLEGDSASVAEGVGIISALCRLPIKQNIAVTGSLDQFGNVQPVGGVNEKIEGFFNVCKEIHSIKGKGVIIPEANIDNLVLKKEVEDAISKGDFSIYSIENIFDGTDILLDKDKEFILSTMQREVKKYSKGKKKE